MAEVNVGDVVARLRVDSSQFDAALRQAQERLRLLTDEVGKQRRAVQESSDAWGKMLQIAGGIGIAAGLGAITAAMVNFARSVVQAGLQTEQLRATLTAIGGSTQAGAAQFQALTDTAQRLGYSLPALAQGFQSISGATRGTVLAGLETQRIFDAITTSARAMGASQGQVERALLAVGQVISKGTVQMEELRGQLAEAIPGAVQIAARAFGVTTEELNKLVASGEVRAIPFIRALTRQMQAELGPAAVQAGETTAAAFARLGNEIMLAAAAIANSGILQMLRTISEAATTVLKDIRQAIQSREQVRSIFEQEALMGTGLRTGQVAEPMLRRLGELQREIDAARASLEQWNRQVEQQPRLADDPELARQRTQLATLEAQRLAIIQAAKTIQDAKDVQAQATAEVNKATVAREREADVLETMRAKLQQIRRDEEAFRRESAFSPETKGRLGGTPEEAERYRRGLSQVLSKSLDELSKLIGQRPAGAPALPADITGEVERLRREYAGLAAAEKAAQDAAQQQRTATAAAEQAAAQAARQAIQDAEEHQRAIDKVTMALAREEDQAVATLTAITARYYQTRPEREEDVIARLTARFPFSAQVQKAAKTAAEAVQYPQIVQAYKDEFTALQQRNTALYEAEDAQAKFNITLQATLDKLRVPREERTEIGLRAQAQRLNVVLTPLQEAQLKAITAQERWNEVWKVTENVVTTTAGHMQAALTGINGQTMSVGAAFKQMAVNIVQSLRDIMLNEGFRRLLSLGLRALEGVILGTAGRSMIDTSQPITVAPTGAGPSNVFRMQGGGIVNRPTYALVGERGMEAVVNRDQMAALMAFARSAAPSAGGQGMGGVTVINFTEANRARAEQRAADEQALGRQVVLNHILSDVGRGESSQLVRALRAMQR